MNAKLLAIAALVILTGTLAALDAEDYMPLAVGYSWTMQDSSEDVIDTFVTQIVDTATMLGYLSFIFVDVYEY